MFPLRSKVKVMLTVALVACYCISFRFTIAAVIQQSQQHQHQTHQHQQQQQQQQHQHQQHGGLHLGAKVALSTLLGIIIMVASATIVDLHSNNAQDTKTHSNRTDHENYNSMLYREAAQHQQQQQQQQQQQKQFHHHFNQQQQQQLPQARDQPSPSLSSCSSSSLFCSANSFTSASEPILGKNHNLHHSLHHQPHQHPHHNERQAFSCQLLKQIFLSFSLRHSASLIFQTSTPNDQQEQQQQQQQQQQQKPRQSIDSLHGLRFLSMIWIIVIHSYDFALRWSFFTNTSSLDNIYKTAASQLLANGTFACDSFFFAAGFLLPYLAFPALDGAAGEFARQNSPLQVRQQQQQLLQHQPQQQVAHSQANSDEQQFQQQPKQQHKQLLLNTNKFTFGKLLSNVLHRYIRMMPLMMAIIGLSATLLRYLGEGPAWDDSTMMFDKWCRKNWWINALFLHNFLNRENMCLSHSWYSAVDIQLFLIGQLILFALFKSRKIGLFICCTFLIGAQLITGVLTLIHHLPAVPLIANYAEQSLNLYYGEVYIKPYCRASPYLIGILLAYLMRTTSLGQTRLKRWQVTTGWLSSISIIVAILFAMQPAMNGQQPSELQSALYSALSRPLWACATGWMIFACITKHGGIFETILSARCFVPLSRLTYPAFLIHPIVMAVFYGSRQTSFHFSHYLMLYLILGNIVITYASAFILSALFELPLLSAERAIKHALLKRAINEHSKGSSANGRQKKEDLSTQIGRKHKRDFECCMIQ